MTLDVETLEARAVPSANAPPVLIGVDGGTALVPVSQAVDSAVVGQHTATGAGVFVPITHGYHAVTGFFGE